METTVQVRKRGVLTLPSELRDKYAIKEGDTFRLVDVDGIFVLTSIVPMVPELAREIEQIRQEAGINRGITTGAERGASVLQSGKV